MTRLIVRDSERHEVMLPSRIRVAGEHISVVRLAAGAPNRDGWIETDLVDLSRTGFGLVSPVFLPRLTLVQVQIFDHGEVDAAEPLVDGVVRIRRVLMTDGRPAYLLGAGLDSTHTMINRQLEELIDRCALNLEGEDISFSDAEGDDA